MTMIMIISLSITLGMLLLSIIFKLAGKLRLTIPLFYLLLTSTILNKWASSHEKTAFIILFLLIAVSLLSWITSFRNFWREKQYFRSMQKDIQWQIERAYQMGISLDATYFDTQGNLRYQFNNELVI